MLKTVKRILIIKLRDIGDIVLSTPVINVLYENSNSPEIIYLVKKGYGNFKYLLPHVKDVIEYEKGSAIEYLRLIFKLRKYKFDLAVNLHASFRSALITLFSGAKFRLVHNHSGRNFFSSVKLNIEEKPKSIIERDLDTLSTLKIPEVPGFMKKTKLEIRNNSVQYVEEDIDLNTIGFGIGASRPVKMWNKVKFVELGKELVAEGRNIAVFCSKAEYKTGKYITDEIGEGAELFCDLDFVKLSYLIKQTGLFIGNDSGLRHIAAAFGVKTITLFGPEDPIEWHPYKESEGHIAILHRLDCINCAKPKCKIKTHECMESISVEEVLKSVHKLYKFKDSKS